MILTAEFEGAQLKCHPYWNTADYGPFNVKVLNERRIPLGSRKCNTHQQTEKGKEEEAAAAAANNGTSGAYLTARHIALSHSSSPFEPVREITQIHYSSWPDFGAPAEPEHLLQLIEEVNKVSREANGNQYNAESLEPEPEGQRRVVVHCSAGCGRTGAFCTIDTVIDMMKRQRSKIVKPLPLQEQWLHEDNMDLIAKTVEDFRLQRLSMVQSLQQFVLCYDCVLEWEASQASRVVSDTSVNGSYTATSPETIATTGSPHECPVGNGDHSDHSEHKESKNGH